VIPCLKTTQQIKTIKITSCGSVSPRFNTAQRFLGGLRQENVVREGEVRLDLS
jgi:hypothetical protein